MKSLKNFLTTLILLALLNISILNSQPTLIFPPPSSDPRILYMIDKYAVEVLLNKPGISYNISMLVSQKGVTKLSSYPWSRIAYAYKSHYSDKLVVIVSEQSLMFKVPTDERREISLAIRLNNTTFEEVTNRIKSVLDKVD